MHSSNVVFIIVLSVTYFVCLILLFYLLLMRDVIDEPVTYFIIFNKIHETMNLSGFFGC